MKLFLTAAAAILLTTGCATQNSVERTNIQLKSIEEHLTVLDMRTTRLEDDKQTRKAIDVTKFCFTNNMAFSEGAIYQGKVCQAKSSLMAFQNGKPIVQPLVWADYKYK